MSFQAYLDNIEAKTRKSPNDFKRLAAAKGYTGNGTLRPGVKALRKKAGWSNATLRLILKHSF